MPTSSRPSAKPAGDPTVALLLTWFVPGAGHLYLGRVGFALAAFVALEGLYLLGISLSGGMLLEYLPPEMRGTFAHVLTPELGNLGMLLYHRSQFGYGPGFPRPWPSTMDVGTLLTAVSGLGNAFVMCRAHIDARLPDRDRTRGVDPPLAAAASLLLPGLGQWLERRRLRAAICFVLLVGLFGLGTGLAQGVNLDRERHFYYWAGQLLLGVPAVVTEFVNGHPRMEHDVAYEDAGIVLACVAGLLNVLVALDAYSWAEARHAAPTSAAAEGAGASAGEAEAARVDERVEVGR